MAFHRWRGVCFGVGAMTPTFQKTALVASLCCFALTACPPPPGACDATGMGSIVVTFSGLPAEVMGKAVLRGPTEQTVTAGQTLMVGSGNWAVSAELVTVSDPVVRTVYAGRVSAPNFCLGRGATQAVDIAWSKVPTSNRLWVGNSSGGTGNLHGFDSAALRATGTTASAWNQDVGGSAGAAFDREGNLWALGNTTVDPLVVRFGAQAFATAVRPMPDRRIDLAAVQCFPRGSALAFDPSGNLYIASPCQKEVYRLNAGQLESAMPMPALTLKGFQSPSALAFDKAGNLFVGDNGGDEVVRYEASALGGSAPMPTVKLKARRSTMPADTSVFGVTALAFDLTGNLWAFDFGSSNVVYAFPAAELSGMGTKSVQPLVRMTVSVTGIPEGLAFDEGGGLWVPLRPGDVVRFSPDQLTVSTGAAAPTPPDRTVTGSALGYARDPAFYPAPKGLPLFHALP
jgi:sugar lactone lactonase YvrE